MTAVDAHSFVFGVSMGYAVLFLLILLVYFLKSGK